MIRGNSKGAGASSVARPSHGGFRHGRAPHRHWPQQALRRRAGPRRLCALGWRRIDHGTHRSKRRRQDDAVQRDHRSHARRRGADPPRRGPPRPAPAALDRPARRRAHVSDPASARADHRAREHAGLRPRSARRAARARVRDAHPRARARGTAPRARARDPVLDGPRAAGLRARRGAVWRTEEASRAGARLDERPAHHPARRARRGREPVAHARTGRGDPRPPGGRAHVPPHRARHGPRHRAVRPGDRDGRGARAHRGAIRDRAPRSPRDRGLSRRGPVSLLLEVRDLVAGYGDSDILRGLSLHVDAGELIAVIGPNGAGKSTLLKVLAGLIPPRAGRIALGGADLTRAGTERMVARGLCYVPQEANVFASLTVWENLTIGAWAAPAAMAARADAVTELFPILAGRRRARAGTLSGGERQMLAMAMALMVEPQLLLLDEPSAGLAPTLQRLVFDRIRAINAGGLGILLVEQNARESLALCHRGYVLAMGRVRAEGPGSVLSEDPDIRHLYLGS